MSEVDTTRLDAAQLARLWAHSPDLVLRAAGELARAHPDDWRVFLEAWCSLFDASPEEGTRILQLLMYVQYRTGASRAL